ncbi:MAG: HAMP domain-containing histidine kinase [Lachnospiraceae bacterium]|nr:HAMP domain-containing histidine kinase [Lachnospiraceae bacterium]
MKQESKVRTVLRLINNYLVFFLMVAFVITCCMTLFITTLSKSLGVDFTAENITVAAKLTFGNVMLLSLIFTIIDAARRRATVEVPVRKILKAAEQIMQGDFSVRISPIGKLGQYNEFDEIINCFNKLAQELGSVETLRTDFIANVSHEMKTPLAVMQNYGTLLQAPGLSEEQRMEYAKGVTDGARRMADMMTNILKLNRLENQQIFPQAEVFDLGEQLCECLLQFENVWEQNNIEIVTDIQDEVKVKGDQELLSLVWNNLLSNAFKFTEPGGWITVSLKEEAGQAVVKIQDTGCGMTPEVGAHIFEKFYQGDTSHSVQGNGLGLALVKRVVDITQGEIGVESTLDKGSTFTVKLRSM